CTFAAPCRTFQKAHDTVAAGGEIDVLDPAGYGSVTVNKSISIQGHGYAGITATSGADAITINAAPSAKVNLRGLLLDGVGIGNDGIHFVSGGSLNIQRSLIRNFSYGVVFSTATTSSLFMSDTVVSDNSTIGVSLGTTGSGALS